VWLASHLGPGATAYTSPLRRCRETLARLGQAGALRVDDRLREIDFGLAEGLTAKEVRKRLPAVTAALKASDPYVDWPGGETWEHFAARVTAAWSDLRAAGGTTLVVSHGVPIRLLLELALGNVAEARQIPSPAQVLHLELKRKWHLVETWKPPPGVPP
jgi:broad specificity phosphatase PhoE